MRTTGNLFKKVIRFFCNIHVLFVLAIILIIVAVYFRFFSWGEHIDLIDFFNHNDVHYQDDTFDQFLPLTEADGTIRKGKENPTIVCFGNAPFADDRYDENNLAKLIEKKSGGKVYNCSITGSYLASLMPYYSSGEAPMDAFNFYWLALLACKKDVEHYIPWAKDTLQDKMPEAYQEVYDTLTTLDFNKVDVIAIMYDASDYLAGHGMYNDENPGDITQFSGNLEAGIEVLQETYPNIRIIVMSPTYAYGINEEGEYISSDIKTYGEDVLSTYVIKECFSTTRHGVSFIDHLYGTITEENAKKYLKDNLHLNTAGRELVADRFIDCLEFFNE